MNAGGGHLLPRARLLGGLQAHTLQREKGPRTIIICRIPKHIPMNITKKNQDNISRSQIIISTVGGRPSATFPQLGSSRPQPPRYVPGGHLHILIPQIHMVDISGLKFIFCLKYLRRVSLTLLSGCLSERSEA